jgi:AraC-like DNA-binding protein
MHDIPHTTISLRSYPSTSSSHHHDHYQWVFSLEGELELEVDSRTNLVQASQGAFIRPQENHCYASSNHNQFLVLDAIQRRDWMMHMSISSFFSLTPAFQKYLQFAKLFIEENNNQEAANEMVKDYLLKLLHRYFLAQYDKRVLLAKNWIDTHFAMPINIEKVAQHCHLSKSQLQRVFRKALGQGVGEYWRLTRLQQAKYLLQSSCKTIDFIAHEIGYESQAAFCRSFASILGLSPTQWRNEQICKKDASPR